MIGLGLMALLTLSATTLAVVTPAPGFEHRGLPSTRGNLTFSAVASSDRELTGTCDPLTVTVNFHSTVAGGTPPYSYSWDFGDNGTSRDPDPRHTYVVMFVDFHVLLRVTDANGALASNSTVFRAVPTPCAPPVGRIPAAAALGAGSWDARSFLGLPGIEEGAPADLVGFARDPREDLSVLSEPALVVLDGLVVRTPERIGDG